MGDKVRITDPGDTSSLLGEVVVKSNFVEMNEDAMAAGGEPASAEVLLLGITRSALYTDSWLSAASFQHTKRVLTDAAANGSIDYLEGLKENVIIGRLIPTTPERLGLVEPESQSEEEDDDQAEPEESKLTQVNQQESEVTDSAVENDSLVA
jgi:DNA-directed RNA polymerase subunit beta'